MKSYYSDEWVTIYHGDCLEVLPSLVPVELVVTDPPYVGLAGGYVMDHSGIGAHRRASLSVGDPWNADLDWFPAVRSKALGGGCWPSAPSTSCPNSGRWSSQVRVALLTWFQRNSVPRGANVPRHTTEFIWAFRFGPGVGWHGFGSTMFDVPRLSTGAVSTGERFTTDGLASHPAQKPLSLMKQLLAVGQGSVLDPFAGTGTTLRAAKDLGRKAVGIEIEERYCEIAARRCSQEVLAL